MGDYILNPQAQRDLRDIWEYISDHSIAAASRKMERLARAFDNLAANPFLGWERPDLAPDLRSFLVENNYIIIYSLSGAGIEIIRVLHGSRDLPSLFR